MRAHPSHDGSLATTRLLRLLPALLPFAGCYEVSDTPTATVITWSTTVDVCCWIIGLMLAWFGARVFRRAPNRGLGIAACVPIAFGMYWCSTYLTDAVTITADAIHDHVGWPWSRHERSLVFADIERVVPHEEQRGSSYRATDRYSVVAWNVHDRRGGVQEFDVHGLWHQASELILERMRRGGVRTGIDPKLLGRPSDDPLVVTLPGGRECRFDAESAADRMNALVMGGTLAGMRRPEGEVTLAEHWRQRHPLTGTWQHRVVDGSRQLQLDLQLSDTGEFRYDVREGSNTLSTDGKWRSSEVEVIFDQAGSFYSLMMPPR